MVTSHITIDKTVAIVGNGTKIIITNNKKNIGVFEVIGDNVTIYNCTFVNNSADSLGGAIYNNCGSGFVVSGVVLLIILQSMVVQSIIWLLLL